LNPAQRHGAGETQSGLQVTCEGGLLPPKSFGCANEVVIASLFCACAREAEYGDLPFNTLTGDLR